MAAKRGTKSSVPGARVPEREHLMTFERYRHECLRRSPKFKQQWQELQDRLHELNLERDRHLEGCDVCRSAWASASNLDMAAESAEARGCASTRAIVDEWAERITGFQSDFPGIDAQTGQWSPLVSVAELGDYRLVMAHQRATREEIATAWASAHPKQRQHSDALRFRLQVFDLYAELGNLPKVAARLGKPRSTVRSAWKAVTRDITPEFDAHAHMAQCAQCLAAVGDRQRDYCSPMKAWLQTVAPDTPSRELPAGRELTPLARSRKQPHRTT